MTSRHGVHLIGVSVGLSLFLVGLACTPRSSEQAVNKPAPAWVDAATGESKPATSVRQSPAGPVAAGSAASSKKGVDPEDLPPDIDPCGLVPRAETERARGPIREGPRPESHTSDYAKACGYVMQNADTVRISVWPAARWDYMKLLNTDGTILSGLGDEAFSVRAPGYSQVWVRTSRALLEVQGNVNVDRLRGIAEIAVSRL